jgi:hypothetical protein
MPLDQIPHNFMTARLEDLVRWGRPTHLYDVDGAWLGRQMMAHGRHHDWRSAWKCSAPAASRQPNDRRRRSQKMAVSTWSTADGEAQVGHLDGRVRAVAACSATSRSCGVSTRSLIDVRAGCLPGPRHSCTASHAAERSVRAGVAPPTKRRPQVAAANSTHLCRGAAGSRSEQAGDVGGRHANVVKMC